LISGNASKQALLIIAGKWQFNNNKTTTITTTGQTDNLTIKQLRVACIQLVCSIEIDLLCFDLI
jgi:hypothetical protein